WPDHDWRTASVNPHASNSTGPSVGDHATPISRQCLSGGRYGLRTGIRKNPTLPPRSAEAGRRAGHGLRASAKAELWRARRAWSRRLRSELHRIVQRLKSRIRPTRYRVNPLRNPLRVPLGVLRIVAPIRNCPHVLEKPLDFQGFFRWSASAYESVRRFASTD